jgi:peroxiredoxin Q/BCP
MLKAGDAAPDFSLPSHSGEVISLSAMRGRKVLLWFYPAAGTPGCTVEGRGFRDDQSYFDENSIQVVGASFDEIEINRAFAEKNGFAFPLLSDCDRKVALAYGACVDSKAASPDRVSFLIDEHGLIARVYDRVDPRDHPASVLADILDG